MIRKSELLALIDVNADDIAELKTQLSDLVKEIKTLKTKVKALEPKKVKVNIVPATKPAKSLAPQPRDKSGKFMKKK